MAELMSNEEVSQLGIYAGVGLTAGAIGVAYGIDSKNPKVKASSAKDKAVADAVVDPRDKKRISNVDKAYDRALKEQKKRNRQLRKDSRQSFADNADTISAMDEINAAEQTQANQWRAHNERLRNVKNQQAELDDSMFRSTSAPGAERTHNEQLRAAQKNAPKPIGAREEAWVASGLAQTESHLDYLRGLPQDTIDIMQKAHHHAENNNYMKVRPMSQAGHESARGFNKVIKAARAVSRAL